MQAEAVDIQAEVVQGQIIEVMEEVEVLIILDQIKQIQLILMEILVMEKLL